MLRPSLWQIALTLFGVVLFSALSSWQWSRAQEKQDILDALSANIIAIPLVDSTPHLRMVEFTGVYDPRVVLLDNQLRNNQRGFSVWSVLRAGNKAVLVDRGWMAAEINRQTGQLLMADVNQYVPPSGQVTVQGYWMTLPKAAFVDNSGSAFIADQPLVLQYPTVSELKVIYGLSLFSGRLIAATDSANEQDENLTRDINPANLINFGPERHLGYAITWACFVVASLIFFVVFARLRAKRLSGKSLGQPQN